MIHTLLIKRRKGTSSEVPLKMWQIIIEKVIYAFTKNINNMSGLVNPSA